MPVRFARTARDHFEFVGICNRNLMHDRCKLIMDNPTIRGCFDGHMIAGFEMFVCPIGKSLNGYLLGSKQLMLLL